jgi:hypothetical protein
MGKLHNTPGWLIFGSLATAYFIAVADHDVQNYRGSGAALPIANILADYPRLSQVKMLLYRQRPEQSQPCHEKRRKVQLAIVHVIIERDKPLAYRRRTGTDPLRAIEQKSTVTKTDMIRGDVSRNHGGRSGRGVTAPRFARAGRMRPTVDTLVFKPSRCRRAGSCVYPTSGCRRRLRPFGSTALSQL